MKRTPGQHTDEGFAHGFGRYFLAELISNSDSFEKLEERLKRHDDEKHKQHLFDEMRFINTVFLVQWVIPEIVGYAYKAGYLKNEKGLYKMIIGSTERNWRISTDEAHKMLEKETEGNSSRVYTPHAMLYLAALGLGEMIHIIRTHVEDPLLKKEALIPLLERANTARNYLVHIPFSSRISIHQEITAALDETRAAHKILDEAFKEQMKRAKQLE